MSIDKAITALAGVIEAPDPESMSWPRPRCPGCDSGHIRLGRPALTESRDSERGHPGFEPEWVRGTFAVSGECDNPACGQTAQVAGDYRVGWTGDEPFHYSHFFNVASVHPPLALMTIPRSLPEDVRDGIARASRVLLVDHGLAATALRAALEQFLTSESIDATDSNGRFRSAHQRIGDWEAAAPARSDVAELFRAAKWIGNDGTHEGATVSLDDVLFGATCLDDAFHRIYTSPGIDARAQQINAMRSQSKTKK